jgi:hypothetical protein
MIDNAENVERELSDAELEAANISGGLLGHHWHGGLGLGLGLGLGGGVFGLGGGVPVVFGGASGSCGSQPTFVEATCRADSPDDWYFLSACIYRWMLVLKVQLMRSHTSVSPDRGIFMLRGKR